jgi:hypothetical protein
MPLTRFLAAAALAAALAPAAPAQIFTDNFNTGTDTGWTRYQPLAGFGAPGTWSFPGGNTYRIQAAASPSSSLGNGRAASYRADLTYSNFFEQVDVVNWNNAISQSFGLAARLQAVGLGTTTGYLFAYDTTGGLNIYRITNEGVTSIGSGSLTLTPGTSYRLTFQGNAAGIFTGSVATVAAPNTPLLSISNATPDTTYASGFPGMVVAEDTAVTNGADATFDNVLFAPSPVPEPSALALAAAGLAGLGLRARRRRQA